MWMVVVAVGPFTIHPHGYHTNFGVWLGALAPTATSFATDNKLDLRKLGF